MAILKPFVCCTFFTSSSKPVITDRRLKITFVSMGPKCTTRDQLRDECFHVANMVEDIDKAAVCCVGYHYHRLRIDITVQYNGVAYRKESGSLSEVGHHKYWHHNASN